MAKQAPIARKEGSTYIFRASAVGGCSLELVAALLGYQPQPRPEVVQAAMKAGQDYEDAILAELEGEGWTLTGHQEKVIARVTKQIIVVGRIDAVGKGLSLEAVFDAKLLGETNYERLMSAGADAFPRYAVQMACYAKGTGLEPALAAMKKNKVTEEPQAGSLRIVPVAWEPWWKKVAGKLKDVVKYAEEGKLPDCDADCWGSPYQYLHRDKNPPVFSDDEQIASLAAEVDEAVFARRELEKKMEEAKKVEAEKKGRLKSALGEPGKVIAGDHYIVFTRTKPSERIDSKEVRAAEDELVAAGIDFSRFVKVGRPQERITVKRKEGEEG